MLGRQVITSAALCLALASAASCSSPAKDRAKQRADAAARKQSRSAQAHAAEPLNPPATRPTTRPTTQRSLAPPLQESWQTARLNVPSQATPVIEGPAPLMYITQGSGIFRVVDRTTGETLAEEFAKGRTVLRVDDKYGVVFGTEVVLKGPRPPGHKYAFYLQADTENYIRQGRIGPKQ